MGWLCAKPVPAASATGPIIRASVRELKRGTVVMLTISRLAQEELFGGSLHGQRVSIQIGNGALEGKLRLCPSDAGEFAVGLLPKGGASVRLMSWAPHITGPQLAALCKVNREADGAVIITLPEWAQPQAARQKMDEQFGIKQFERGKP